MVELVYVRLGAHPSHEDGADPHVDGIGYVPRALNECEALIGQLLRILGPPADDVTAFVVHRSGKPEQLEVGVLYDRQSQAGCRYAERCRREFPATWDAGARLQLDARCERQSLSDEVRRIDPAQAGFWEKIGKRPLTAEDTDPYGVEFLTDRQRLAEVSRQYPVPTVIDIGQGIFGAPVGLVYVDDDTGRAVAYAPPEIHRAGRSRTEP